MHDALQRLLIADLVADHLRRLLDLHLEFVDDAQRELAPGDAPP